MWTGDFYSPHAALFTMDPVGMKPRYLQISKMQQENKETELPLHGRLQTLISSYFTQFALNFFY